MRADHFDAATGLPLPQGSDERDEDALGYSDEAAAAFGQQLREDYVARQIERVKQTYGAKLAEARPGEKPPGSRR
jgi:hypothetical protein